MPELIEHIDSMARRLGRDVLFAAFEHDPIAPPPRWETSKVRKRLIAFLDEEGVHWEECAGLARENLVEYYVGQIFIDVPTALDDAQYRKVCGFCEFPDGTPRHSDFRLYLLPLTTAMKSAHHDEPGFWERMAERL